MQQLRVFLQFDFSVHFIDVAREVVNMRNLESESQHMELANEDGNDELNVALGKT